MKYAHIVTGTFLSRPNRFIAHVEIKGQQIIAHVKNTGRCRELLIPGATVILEYHPQAAASGRKTEYDLIAVWKGELLINMDSQAPNKAAWEWILGPGGAKLCPGWQPQDVRREVTHGDSRFDLAFTLKNEDGEAENGREISAFMEVKGVTLEENGSVMFPDAPTERGVKHLNGLINAAKEGYMTFVLFVIQMKGVTSFQPNDKTHPAFGEALRRAKAEGVHILAYDCAVTPDSMEIDESVPVVT